MTSQAPLPRLLLENGAGAGHLVGGDLWNNLPPWWRRYPARQVSASTPPICSPPGYPVHEAEGLERLVSSAATLAFWTR